MGILESKPSEQPEQSIATQELFLPPEERKDKGAIHYISVAETIKQWEKDPHGQHVFDFLSRGYNLDTEQVGPVLEKAGMEEYLKYKQEGRFIGMAATQILRPSYYFLANAKMLNEIHKKGIPTAFMILEYPQDTYFSENSDKKTAFGKIEFPVGVEEIIDKDGNLIQKVKTTSIELRPTAIRHDDGTIQRISTIHQANGFRIDQILVQVTDAHGPDGQSYKIIEEEEKTSEGNKVNIKKRAKVHYAGALGFAVEGLTNERTTINNTEVYDGINRDSLSLTDFYRLLWKQTVAHLRESGELPTEEEMPMFFVDMTKLYTTLAKETTPHPDIVKKLKFDSEENIATYVLAEDASISPADALEKHRLKIENGFLIHENGMMTSAAYYPLQVAWPDLYMECSSCGGEKFVDNLERAQEVREEYDLPITEVRLPDQEFPEMERYTIHPTGKYAPLYQKTDRRAIELAEALRKVKEAAKESGASKKDTQQAIAPFVQELAQRKKITAETLRQKLEILDASEFLQVGYIEPKIVTIVHNELLRHD